MILRFDRGAFRNRGCARVINSVVSLAKTRKVCGVPAILTTVVEERVRWLHSLVRDQQVRSPNNSSRLILAVC
jgi:hypothetical protein